MKNIWIFYQDGGTPKQGWGDRHFFLAKEYIKRDFKVTIFAGNNCHRYNNPVQVEGNFRYENVDGVDYCWVKIPAYSDSLSVTRIFSWFLFAFKLLFVSKQRVGRPDIIVVSSIPIFPIVSALLYKMVYRAKVIFEIRDIWPLTVIQVGNYSKFHPFVLLLRWIELWGYRRSDHIVSVLQFADAHIRNSISKPFRYTWISNGFSREYLDQHYALSDFNAIPDKFIVGYAGTFGISNANEFLIEAAKILKAQNDIHFVLVGDGPEKERLKKLAVGLDNVTFIPKVPKANIQFILEKFDLAYVGSKHLEIYKYGISANKMFDYMVAGLPIILSSQFQENMISSAKCGVTVNPESGLKIAEAVLELKTMPEKERQTIGSNGRKFALDNFLYENLALKFVNIFFE